MPLYEYRCHRCGHTFEVLQKFADEPLTVHDECGGEVERLISPPAFQFKGSGWYVTDYARNGNSSAAGNGKSDSKEGKTEAKSESSKVESKPSAPSPSSSTSAEK